MSDARECALTVVTGQKGVGKSYRTIQEIDLYLQTDFSSGRKGRKVLIFDVNNDPQYVKYRSLDFNVDEPDDFRRGEIIRRFASSEIVEARRIIPVKKNGRPFEFNDFTKTIRCVADNFKYGLFVAEDINKYITHKNSDMILDMLITLRHKNMDMIILLQTLSKVTTTMWENMNYLRMHKQGDNVDRYKNRIPNYQIVKLAEIIVSKRFLSGDVRNPVYCSPTDDRFFDVSEDEYKGACRNYLLDFEKDLKKYQRLTDSSGKLLYPSRYDAEEQWIKEHEYMIRTY